LIISFTGTREGMTVAQKQLVAYLLTKFKTISYVKHGDCLGADADFDAIATELKLSRHIFPANIPAMRAYCDSRGAFLAKYPLPPLERNKLIIAGSNYLIACPKGPEQLRSGTWSTIRAAHKLNLKTSTIYPDGTVL